MKRVVIFQYNFPIQTHTINLINAFKNNGYSVDFFYFLNQQTEAFVSLNEISNFGEIIVKNIYFKKYSIRSFLNKTLKFLINFGFLKGSKLLNPLVIRETLCEFRKHFEEYSFIIGVEKYGLIWASEIGNHYKVPYFYYSLELYNKLHPSFSSGFERLFEEELKAYIDADGLIIQDEDRYKVIKRDMGVEKEYICLPVSCNGEKMLSKSSFLNKKFNIDKPIILNIGINHKGRKIEELIESWKKNETGMVLVLHGIIDPDIRKMSEDAKDVIISDEFVASEKQYEIVSSAFIGLALYDNSIENDKLTAFSSAKIALYCQSGIPFIAIENESYLKLKNEYDCCVLITDIRELSIAITEITEKYDYFRKNSFKAYDDIYCFKRHVNRVVHEIEKIVFLKGSTENK